MKVLQSKTVLSNDEIKLMAPSVFTDSPSSDVSKHYTHISTSTVVEDMRMLGWDVVDAKEVNARKGVGFQKHLVIFQNPGLVINGDDGDTVFPQILLTNSHDGKNAFRFTAGLFRMICENGLVIATTQFEDVKMRHMGYTFEELQINIRDMVERLPETVETMNVMKKTQMGEEQSIEFAKKSLETRFNKEEMKTIQVDLKDLLSPTRKEDGGSDLWSVFNVIQEKLIDGGFIYRSGNKSRKARQIKNFSQDQKVNQKLFSLALEYTS
tara:strand:+ start:667 stop:1467 length:801 start_codon:yes stop_codon:yes gene_type:complete